MFRSLSNKRRENCSHQQLPTHHLQAKGPVYVPADLGLVDLGEVLKGSGFDPALVSEERLNAHS